MSKDIEAIRPLVYICSAYAGDIEHNVSRARGYCRFAVSEGYIPLAPHLLFPQFMDDGDPEQRALGIRCGLEFLRICREVWVFGEHITQGMEKEVIAAKKLGLPIRAFNPKCEEVGRL
jgi:hypothetical protein